MTTQPSTTTSTGAAAHPWAWWCWALTVAAAVNLTTNPLLLALLAFGVTAVVILRRSQAPWARSVGAYFVLAGVIIGIRLFFQVLIGAPIGSTVLIHLPEIALPDWAQGIRLGGDVTAEGVLLTGYDALRLATMLLCLGAANALANPRQALRSVPAALYEASVAVVIALSVAPQLIESAQRVRRARRLRGGSVRGLRWLGALLVPVLQDAIERSLALAAGMEARGFGRTVEVRHRRRLLTLMLTASMVLTFGAFELLSGSTAVGIAGLVVGAAGTIGGLRLTGHRLRVTRYRPHPWGWRETALACAGIATTAAVVFIGSLNSEFLTPVTEPPSWPQLHPLMLVALAFTLLPIAVTRRPETGSAREPNSSGLIAVRRPDHLRPRTHREPVAA